MVSEKTVRWELIASFPDLARHLAMRDGDRVKVEVGYEISPVGIRTEKFLLVIERLIGEHWHYFSETYLRNEFRGAYTANKFKDYAHHYFEEEEIKYKQKVN